MALVKVRRVGNSNVVTLPAGIGGRDFQPGTAVLVEELADGTLRLTPVPDLEAHVRQVAQGAIERRREALEILRQHDRDAAGVPGAVA